jgi:hypothetical protein
MVLPSDKLGHVANGTTKGSGALIWHCTAQLHPMTTNATGGKKETQLWT